MNYMQFVIILEVQVEDIILLLPRISKIKNGMILMILTHQQLIIWIKILLIYYFIGENKIDF